MARELAHQHFFERDAVFELVGFDDFADGAVAAVGEEGAHGELVRAEAAFGRAVELADVGVDLLREHGRGLFLAVGGEDHGEEAIGFAGEVAAYVGFEGAVEFLLVGDFDGVEVGVGAREEDVVEESLICARAFKGFVG